MKKLGSNQFQAPNGEQWDMKQTKAYYASKRILADQPRPKDVKAEEEIKKVQ